MFRDIFKNRLFIGALAIFIFSVGGSLLYRWHVERQGAEDAAETETRVEQWNERQKEQPTAETPVAEQSEEPQQVEHVHEDGTFHPETHVEEPQTQEAVPNAQKSQPLDDDIKELYDKLQTEGFKPENLSEKQLLHLREVGLNWDYLSPEQQDEAERNYYAKYGLNPPPRGYSYELQAAGVPVLDENGNALIHKDDDTSVIKSFGGYLLDVENEK